MYISALALRQRETICRWRLQCTGSTDESLPVVFLQHLLKLLGRVLLLVDQFLARVQRLVQFLLQDLNFRVRVVLFDLEEKECVEKEFQS